MVSSNQVVLICLSVAICCASAVVHVTKVLSASDQEQIRKVFEATPYSDVSSAYHAVIGLKSLSQGGALPSTISKAACNAVKAADVKDLESMFYASSVVKALGASCKHDFTAAVTDSISKKIEDGADVKTLYHATSFLSNIGKKIPATVLTYLTNVLGDDESVYSSSLAILTTLNLGDAAGIKALLEKNLDVEDLAAQADEVDEKYLHFENDLRTTATFVRAAFELAKAKKRPLGLTQDQVIMFANFILKQKGASPEAACNVAASLNAIVSYTGAGFGKVQLLSGNTISQDKGSIKVSVVNLLNQPIEGLTIKIDSVTRSSDNEVIISNVPMKKSIAASVTSYDLNMWDLKPKSGFYDVTLNVVPGSGRKLAGTSDVEFRVKVTTSIEILNPQIGTQEPESTAVDWQKLAYPSKAPNMKADSQQKVIMTFQVKDKIDNTPMKPHQVFVLFQNVKTYQEVIFVAEADGKSNYKFDVDLSTAGKDSFNARSGEYTVHLIIGDAAISNPVYWHVCNIKLSFSGSAQAAEPQSIYAPKPEIHHIFRESEKRPPVVVSTVFTAACIAPLFFLIVSWLRTGLNLSNMRFAPKNLIFHSGLIAIFLLYYFFWLQLNMFTTLRYLALLGSITFIAGNKVLAQQAAE